MACAKSLRSLLFFARMFRQAGVSKLADETDSKSVVVAPRVGSSPTTSISHAGNAWLFLYDSLPRGNLKNVRRIL